MRVLLLLLLAWPARADLIRYWSGNAEDVRPRLHGPLLLLAGGGGDVAAGMQAAIDQLRGCADCEAALDVVVLRASGAEGYNPWYMSMRGVDSIVSMVITDRDSAHRPDVVATVRQAELVFFAGGDQCNYIRWIKGTPVERAVKSVYRRRGGVGGTSAGLAILGEIAYDACPSQSAQSKEVLADPFHADVSLSRGFFDFPPLRDTITDTHFVERARLGRLLVFLARALDERKERRLLGLGVDRGTILLLDGHGRGRVFGEGPVQVIEAGDRAEVLRRGTPLTFRALKMWEFRPGETLDLRALPAGWKRLDVIEGKLQPTPQR